MTLRKSTALIFMLVIMLFTAGMGGSDEAADEAAYTLSIPSDTYSLPYVYTTGYVVQFFINGHKSANSVSQTVGVTVNYNNTVPWGQHMDSITYTAQAVYLPIDIGTHRSLRKQLGGFYQACPGIYVPSGKTLAIKGSGFLLATTSKGDGHPAGCDNCGNITITNGVNVSVYRGNMVTHSIGVGYSGSCGTVTIQGTVYSIMIRTKIVLLALLAALWAVQALCGPILISGFEIIHLKAWTIQQDVSFRNPQAQYCS